MRGGRRCELSASARLPERQHLGVIELHVREGALLLRELPADKVHGYVAVPRTRTALPHSQPRGTRTAVALRPDHDSRAIRRLAPVSSVMIQAAAQDCIRLARPERVDVAFRRMDDDGEICSTSRSRRLQSESRTPRSRLPSQPALADTTMFRGMATLRRSASRPVVTDFS